MSADRLGARFLQDPLTRAFSTVLADVRSLDLGGQVADYIPELANVDADAFGIAATSIAGHTYATGDSATTFTIQSISKPFVFALVLAEIGFDRFLEHVGVEPSGEAFNAISFDDAGRPANPLINAGAIVTTSLMPATSADERFARIRDGLSVFAGRTLAIDQRVYDSESRTGNRNRALATLALSTGVLASSVDGAAEPYFQQCSLLIDTADLALMGATLANNGVNPRTGVRAVSAEVARHVLSVMSACGMYDRSDQPVHIAEVDPPRSRRGRHAGCCRAGRRRGGSAAAGGRPAAARERDPEDRVRVFRGSGARPQTRTVIDYVRAHADRFGVEPILAVLAIVSCVGGLRELGREDVGRQDLGCCAEEVLVGHQGCDDGAVGVGVASGLVGECIEDPEGVGVGPDREPDNRSYFFVGECDSAGEQIGDRVVLSIGRDDLGDEGIRK